MGGSTWSSNKGGVESVGQEGWVGRSWVGGGRVRGLKALSQHATVHVSQSTVGDAKLFGCALTLFFSNLLTRMLKRAEKA